MFAFFGVQKGNAMRPLWMEVMLEMQEQFQVRPLWMEVMLEMQEQFLVRHEHSPIKAVLVLE